VQGSKCIIQNITFPIDVGAQMTVFGLDQKEFARDFVLTIATC
jgi:hypothetical protein